MTVRLRAGDAVLEVDPDRGGRWTSLVVAGHELLDSAAEVPGLYPPVLHGCFPMAPYAGRTGGAVLRWRGEEHPLPPTAAPHALHGTVLDVAWRTAAQDDASLDLSTPLGPHWPFAGRVRQELRLTARSLHARLALHAEQDMPVVLGLHPWFRRELAGGARAVLLLEGGSQYVRGADGLPTGELVPPSPGPWDDCFTGLSAPPRLRWPGALELELRSSGDHWVVFDERPDVLCVEPQTGPPDAVRLGRAAVVRAGDELALDVVLEWQPA